MRFEDTINILSNPFSYTVIEPTRKDIVHLSNQFGMSVVLKAQQDKTSILAHQFIEHKKPIIKLEYTLIEKSDPITEKKLVESLKAQFKETFPNTPLSKEIKQQIKEFILEPDMNKSVKIIKVDLNEENIKNHQFYFQRILEIAKLSSKEPSKKGNKYLLALKIANEWPFLASYVHGNSLIDNKSVLMDELQIRKSYLEQIKTIQGAHKKVLKLLIRSFPNLISSHPDLEKSIKKVSSAFDCIKSLNLCGILMKDEIKKMKDFFNASRRALHRKNQPWGITQEDETYNKIIKYYIWSKDNQIYFKAFKKLKDYQYEIAGNEMSEIGGFSCIVTTLKRSSFIYTHYNKNGNFIQSKNINGLFGINEDKLNNYFTVSRPFFNCFPGNQLLYQIKNKLNNTKVKDNSLLRTDSYQNNIRQLTVDVTPFYFEMAILHSLLLGSRDANIGNLFFKGKIIFPIDNEQIMPENNANSSLFISLPTKLKFLYESFKKIQYDPIEVKDYELKDVCSINCALVGFPQANSPFSKHTIKHVLQNLHEENFIRYHQRKRLFNENQVSAQLARITLIRELMEIENQKEVITLTPKDLFLAVVQKHETYEILKNHYHLTDFFIFTHLGRIPKEITLNEVSNLAEKLKERTIKKKLKAIKNRIKKSEFEPFSSKILNNEYYASAYTLIKLQKSLALQAKMMHDDGLYYLLTGEKREPDHKKAPTDIFSPR